MNTTTKLDSSKRLARIAGQVNGIQKMIEDDRYCVDILTQLAALRAALDQLGVQLLSTHLETCVFGNDPEHLHEHCKTMTAEERLEEIKVTLNRFLK